MARIRSIKPEFFTDPELYELETATGLPIRIAFAGLWCQADREGRFKWQPRVLKLGILPFDSCDFAAVMDTLAGAGLVIRYSVDGREYGAIRNFAKHQRPHKREVPSELPPVPTCGNQGAAPVKVVPETGKGCLGPGCNPVEPVGKGASRERVGKGMEGGKENPPPPVSGPEPPDMEDGIRLATATTLPPGARLTEALRVAAIREGLVGSTHPVAGEDPVAVEWREFCDHARETAKTSHDWPTTWARWVRRRVRWNAEGKTNGTPGKPASGFPKSDPAIWRTA